MCDEVSGHGKCVYGVVNEKKFAASFLMFFSKIPWK